MSPKKRTRKSEDETRTSRISLILAIIGTAIAIIATAAAIVVVPEIRILVGLDRTATPEPAYPKMQCSTYDGNIVEPQIERYSEDYVYCQVNISRGETLAGTAISLGQKGDPDHIPCAACILMGPLRINNIEARGITWDVYDGINSQTLAAQLIKAKEQLLIRKPGTCFQQQTSSLIFPTQITIPGNTEGGVIFETIFQGTYEIEIIDGAYSPFPWDDDTTGVWRTMIYIYMNSKPIWGERQRTSSDSNNVIYFEPVDPHARIGNFELQSREAATIIGQLSATVTLTLESTDYLVLIPIDDQDWYNHPLPNLGEVNIEIRLIGQ